MKQKKAVNHRIEKQKFFKSHEKTLTNQEDAIVAEIDIREKCIDIEAVLDQMKSEEGVEGDLEVHLLTNEGDAEEDREVHLAKIDTEGGGGALPLHPLLPQKEGINGKFENGFIHFYFNFFIVF